MKLGLRPEDGSMTNSEFYAIVMACEQFANHAEKAPIVHATDHVYRFDNSILLLTESSGGYEDPIYPLIIIAASGIEISRTKFSLEKMLGFGLRKSKLLDARIGGI